MTYPEFNSTERNAERDCFDRYARSAVSKRRKQVTEAMQKEEGEEHEQDKY